MYYFSYLYPYADKPLKYRLNLLVLLPLLYAIFFTEFVTLAVVENGKVVFIDGFGYTLYSIYEIALYLLVFYHLFRSYFLHQKYRVHIVYLFIGIILSSTLAIFFCLILPLFGNYDHGIHGYLSSIFMSFTFIYAILKHGLLDIVIVKKKTAWLLTGSIVVISFIVMYQATRHDSSFNIVTITLLGLFWAIYAHPLQIFLITTAKRKFVRGWYDPGDYHHSIIRNPGD